MSKSNLSENDVYHIAASFRSAIIAAKRNREFKVKDRMSCFPFGCCDDSCDLLAYYLYDRYKIYTIQGNGVYRDNNPYNTTNHAWLVMDGDTIIDITIDQFGLRSIFDEDVYVGKEISFYKMLENRERYENSDITQIDRLRNDYKIIISYMSEEIL